MLQKYIFETKLEKTLSEKDKSICDGEITVTECSDAVNEMKLNKSPGLDGLSVEFYRTFWDKLKYFLIKTYNQRLSRACIVHLVIKKNNWSYVKTMSCSGSHLGITINIKNTKFVKDLPMIDAQFRFNQCNSFREEYISVFSPYGSVLIL